MMKLVGVIDGKSNQELNKYNCDVDSMGDVITPISLDLSDDDNNSFQYFDEYSDGHCDYGEDIYTYPSGRVSLVPIHINKNTNNQIKINSQSEEQKGYAKEVHPSSPECGSWLSNTFCIVSSNSTLDTVDDISNYDIVKNMSFEEHHVCFINDEGSVVQDESDECNEYQNSIHQQKYGQQSSHIANAGHQQLDETFDMVGDGNLICGTWQNWYNGKKMKKCKQSHKPSKVLTSSLLFNSSRQPSKKKKRMQFLQSNLEPFGNDDLDANFISSELAKPIELKKTSMSLSNSKKHSQPFESLREGRSTSNDCGWHSNIIACGTLSQAQEIEILPTTKFGIENDNCNEDLCYDSDPCEMMAQVGRDKILKQNSIDNSRMYRASTNDGDVDEDTSLDIISEHMAAKMLLVWHKDTKMESTDTSIAVHAWIERGSRIHSGLVQPKLCWRKIYPKGYQSIDRLKTDFTFHSVDLLDISKIIPMNEVLDRECHPFVKRRHSFLVEAFGGDLAMVFEARNEAKRDEIVEGLKLIVARLGSLIMVGDISVLNEFFSPIGSVPGHIPGIINGE